MNSEQNNNMFGIPNQIPPVSGNNQNMGETVIPGSNLTPIGAEPITSPASAQVEIVNSNDMNGTTNMNIPIQPIPGMVDNNAVNSVIPESNNNIISVDSSSVIPGIVNSTPINNGIDGAVQPNNNLGTDLNQALNVNATSPFDIGLGGTTLPDTNTQITEPILPVNNSVPNTVNEAISPLNNGTMTAPNNMGSMGDATPLTNESTNNVGDDDNIVSVKKYLLHIILFSIPVVGVIMLLVKAFGEKKDKNISNFAKAQLLLSVIVVVLGIVISVVFGTTFAAIMGDTSSQATTDYNYSVDYNY